MNTDKCLWNNPVRARMVKDKGGNPLPREWKVKAQGRKTS